VLLLAGRPAAAATTVRVGVLGAISDAAFFVAEKKGYFRDEGITIEFVHFAAAAQMVAPLGDGQLEVGAGATSAGLYNSAARNIDIRIVADKGSMPPSYGYMPLMVRKDLIESGKFKTLKDLKGLKLGSQSVGGAATVTLEEALREAGLGFGDVEVVYMGHPQLALAIENHAIDAAFITEPNATSAVLRGGAVRFARGDEIYPNQQLSVVLYNGGFATKSPALARQFMRAYIRGSRDYNDALKDGKLAGRGAEDIIAILVASTEVKDPAIYRAMIPHGCDPDGNVNVASLKKDFESFRAQGLIKGETSVERVLDQSFARAAVAELGPYKRRE
jgi:NitT/TauT family transport system substrate-binding protein